MKYSLILSMLLLSSVCFPSISQFTTKLSAQEPANVDALSAAQLETGRLQQGWIRLFDGQSLVGWETNSQTDWRIVDGTITVSSGEKGLLTTTSQWDNYELELEFQSDTNTNSGVFLRTPRKPTNPAQDCYELNIAPSDNPFPTGSLVGRQRIANDLVLVSKPNQWYSFRARLDRGEVTIWLDGKEVLKYTDPQPLKTGHIGLQLNSGRAAFRNIQIRPLGLQSLIPMKDLAQWITTQAGTTKFTVNETGGLRLEGGKGQLESKQAWGDFVLQMRGVLDHDHSNSGLFFRCIPGEPLNGYECQLHQGFLENNRSKPADGGLGGIFRRQNARAVLGNVNQPFYLTLVAQGPHLATWVNGVPIADFTDTRKPDPNPRKGLRVEAGPIMLQGHDPETRLTIVSLSISPP
jgi:hypothetical protein